MWEARNKIEGYQQFSPAGALALGDLGELSGGPEVDVARHSYEVMADILTDTIRGIESEKIEWTKGYGYADVLDALADIPSYDTAQNS